MIHSLFWAGRIRAMNLGPAEVVPCFVYPLQRRRDLGGSSMGKGDPALGMAMVIG